MTSHTNDAPGFRRLHAIVDGDHLDPERTKMEDHPNRAQGPKPDAVVAEYAACNRRLRDRAERAEAQLHDITVAHGRERTRVQALQDTIDTYTLEVTTLQRCLNATKKNLRYARSFQIPLLIFCAIALTFLLVVAAS